MERLARDGALASLFWILWAVGFVLWKPVSPACILIPVIYTIFLMTQGHAPEDTTLVWLLIGSFFPIVVILGTCFTYLKYYEQTRELAWVITLPTSVILFSVYAGIMGKLAVLEERKVSDRLHRRRAYILGAFPFFGWIFAWIVHRYALLPNEHQKDGRG